MAPRLQFWYPLPMSQMLAPCTLCHHETNHNILHSVSRNDPFDQDYYFLECAGCGTVSMANCGPFGEVYYPSPITRQIPSWLSESDRFDDFLGEPALIAMGHLLHEIYQGVRGGQRRLAVMGVRALLEQIMISNVGDQGTFVQNLDAFHQRGYASLLQRDQLVAILDAGHAVMHRAYVPKAKDLGAALDIVEGIMASIYVHPDLAEKLAGAVPKRQQKPKDR